MAAEIRACADVFMIRQNDVLAIRVAIPYLRVVNLYPRSRNNEINTHTFVTLDARGIGGCR